MAVLKLLLNSSLLFLIATTLCSGEILRNNSGITDYRLQDYVIPTHYDIKLLPYIDEQNNFSFHGEISVLIRITASTEHLRLHMLNLEVKTTKLVKREENFTISPEYPLKKSNYIQETQILEIYFDKELLHGEYILTMLFYGAHNNSEESFFVTSYVKENHKEWLIATRFGARRIFPCWDEPALKTTFNISIKHHNKYEVLSNEQIRNQSVDFVQFDMMWTYFHTTPKISTYQIGIVLFEFPEFQLKHESKCIIGDIRFRHYNMSSHIDFAQKIAGSVMKKLVATFKSMKDFPKVQVVAIPGFPNDGMSYFGLVFYREDAIIYNSKLDPIGRKLEVASLVARHIAHQCFGNLVSPSWWSSWWLYDAAAILFGTSSYSQVFPDIFLTELFVIQHQHESLHLDSYFNISTNSSLYNYSPEIDSFFFSLSSYKVASTLRMLQNIISSEIYENGISKFIDTYAYSSATSDNLWTVMQGVFNETQINDTFYSNIIIKLMSSWTKLRHYPMLNVKRETHFGHWNWINVSIHNFNALKIYDKVLYIPVTIITQMYPDFDKLNYNFIDCDWKSCSHSFSADYAQKDWILINLQQVGYYRVNYNPDIWQSIVTYLNSPNYTKIHLLNRAQIIDDAFHFMMAGKLESTLIESIFFNLTSYLSHETNYVAWYPMFKALEYISRIFAIPDERVDKLKKAIVMPMNQLLNNIGYAEEEVYHDKSISALRQEAVKWACILDDFECLKHASRELSWHLLNHKEHKLLPWWEKWTYCNGLKRSKKDNWYKVFQIWATTPDNKILEFLTCSNTHPSRVIHSYNRTSALKNNTAIRIKDYINHFLIFTANYAKSEHVMNFVLPKIQQLKTKSLNAFAAYSIVIDNAYAQKTFDMLFGVVETDLSELESCVLDIIQSTLTETLSIIIKEIEDIVFDAKYKYKMNSHLYEILITYIKQGKERINWHIIKHKIKRDTSKIGHRINDNIEQIKSIVKSKIKTRQSEIEKHKQYLQIFSVPTA